MLVIYWETCRIQFSFALQKCTFYTICLFVPYLLVALKKVIGEFKVTEVYNEPGYKKMYTQV